MDSPITLRTDSSQHPGDSTGNDKVEQPLCRSSKGDVQTAETGSRDFRDVDPADRTPSELEESGEEEDADKGNVASRNHRFACLGGLDADIETDVQHCKALRDGSPEERTTAAEGVGNEDQEAGTSDDFDDTVHSCCEKTVGAACDTQVLEDLRSVVVDGIRSSHLLTDHEEDTDNGTLAVAGDQPHLLEKVEEVRAAHELALILQLLDNVLEFILHIWVV